MKNVLPFVLNYLVNIKLLYIFQILQRGLLGGLAAGNYKYFPFPRVQRQSSGDEYLAGVVSGDFRKKYSENNSHINTKKQGKTDLIRRG